MTRRVLEQTLRHLIKSTAKKKKSGRGGHHSGDVAGGRWGKVAEEGK